jgi:hypothetical protein
MRVFRRCRSEFQLKYNWLILLATQQNRYGAPNHLPVFLRKTTRRCFSYSPLCRRGPARWHSSLSWPPRFLCTNNKGVYLHKSQVVILNCSLTSNRGSSFSIVTALGLARPRNCRFKYRHRQEDFFFSCRAPSPALGPAHFIIQWTPEAVSLGLQKPACELAKHHQLEPNLRNSGAVPPVRISSWRDIYLNTGKTLALFLLKALTHLTICRSHFLHSVYFVLTL